MIVFRKARNPQQTLNDLDEYLRTVGDKPVRWLAREVQSWGEFSYDEIAALIESGQLDALIDWQEHWAGVVNQTLAPMWLKAIEEASSKATKGMTVLSDSNDYVKAWVSSHGGELITLLSDESRKAISNILLRGQGLRMAPRDIAKEIRPLIGLTDRQAQANVKYKDTVYQKLLDNGMSESKARERSEAAALRYAGKQHRYRAESIILTENAFAYNRGAHMGVSQSIADGYMGRCEMVWTTAGTNRVCGRCMELKDTVVGTTDQSGVTIPPLHPRCRCAIMYREVGVPRVMQPKPKPKDFKGEVETLRKELMAQRARGATAAEMEVTIKAAGRLVVEEVKKIKPHELPAEERDLVFLNRTCINFRKRIDGLYDAKNISEELYNELNQILDKMRKELHDFCNRRFNEDYTNHQERAKQLKMLLEQIRPMGMSPKKLKKQFGSSRSVARKFLEEGLACYPTEWIEASIQYSELTPLDAKSKKAYYWRERRGYYDGTNIVVDADALKRLATSVHEFAHRFEEVVKRLREAEAEFYRRRTAGEPLEKMKDLFPGSGYKDYEVTRKDKFLAAYMGKDYNGQAYELVSMGFQWAYTDPAKLLQDTDMAEWIYGLLAIF